MKILAAIVIPPHLIFSGAVTAAEELSKSMANYCHVDIAIMSTSSYFERSGNANKYYRKSSLLFPIMENFLPRNYRAPLYKSDIPEMIKAGSYDLIHIHNVMPALEMMRIAQACVEIRKPYVISTHGFVEVANGSNSYGLNPVQRVGWKYLVTKPIRYVVQHASMIFLSSEAESPFIDGFGGSHVKKRFVKNGVNELFFEDPSPDSVMKICQKFALPVDKNPMKPVTIFLGNHTRNKGIRVLLDAFLRIDRPYLLIIGGEKRAHINYEYYLSSRKENQTIVFTDKLSIEEIIALYHYADLFAFPTLADTFPLVILEAMAAGLPVLSTTVGGIPYQVNDQCGVLVEPNNVLLLKDAYEKMTANWDILKQMGRNSKLRASHFSWENSAREAVSYYKEVLTSN